MRRHIYLLGLLASLALVVLLVSSTSSLASAGGPRWVITSLSQPTNFVPGSTSDLYVVRATNVGGAATDGPITIEDTLPAGVEEAEIDGAKSGGDIFSGEKSNGESKLPLQCTTVSEPLRQYRCTFSSSVSPADTLKFVIKVSVIAPVGTVLPSNSATVFGGGAEEAQTNEATSAPTLVSNQSASFGITNFFTASSTAQAGAHPNFTTSFALSADLGSHPASAIKDVGVDLPPGLIGDPFAVRPCSVDDVANARCPEQSAVGVATVEIPNGGTGSSPYVELVYSVTPYAGEPAAFAFAIDGVATVRLDAGVIASSSLSSDGTYAVHVSVSDVSEAESVIASTVTFWGVPADYNGPGPDVSSEGSPHVTFGEPGSESQTARPFMRNPTTCDGVSATGLEMDSWSEPGPVNADGTPDVSDPRWKTAESSIPMPALDGGFTGCGLLAALFTPSIEVAPERKQAGAPAGYEVDLNASQNNNAEGFAAPDLKNVTLTLPAGTIVSPAAANGLEACSEAQLAVASTAVATCPRGSQIGTVDIKTPLLEEELKGQVFLGEPECSPCSPGQAAEGAMVRLYLQAEYGRGESKGKYVRIKLAGRTRIDQGTGRLESVFELNPQLPFSELRLHLDGGTDAPLANPLVCGTATTTTQLMPWSSTLQEPIVVEPSSSFQVEGCSAPRFAPYFTAGMTGSAEAGGYSPFSVAFSRTDQDQDFGGITVNTPPGLLGMVSHVLLCGEAQANAGTCGAESQIGEATIAVGPGTEPFWVKGGRVYLTGRYDGAPYGLSVVVPAEAGPFKLAGNTGMGVEVVRAAISVNPMTAALTIASGQFPSELDGIPLQIKTVDVNVNRPQFMFNGTNCAGGMAVAASIASTQGTKADVSSPYQPVNCATLPFKPALTASTQAKTSKADGASLTVDVASAGIGQANIAKVDLTIPKILPSRLTTLQKACTEAQFNANPAGCPAASDIATAVVHTPLLNSPLQGPAYFVSHGGAAFPDVEIVLQGEGVTIVLDGHTQIKNGVTYSRFETVPDAPFTTFEFNAPEGPYSIFTASGNLCAHKIAIPTTIVGQNGAQIKQSTTVAVEGCSNALSISSHRIKKRKLTLKVYVPAAGKLVASGKGVRTGRKTSKGRGTVKITLHQKHAGRLQTRLRVVYTPTAGKARKRQVKTLKVHFRK